MIEAPFRADETFARRMAALAASVGPAVEVEIEAIVAASVAPASSAGPLAGSTVPASAVAELVQRHELASERELALLALPIARAMARPPISGYRVAAVGIEADSGDLVLGANLEFPGTDLGTTVHAEGFVALRARRRGRTLETLAVREAHPCAHCRQTLAESSAADRLEIIDPLGHELTLDELYPWPFRPAALGDPGDVAGLVAWPSLRVDGVDGVDGADVPAEVASLLVEVGSRAHAPYSGAPSAVAIRLADGRLLAAGCVESVAFNPSISATQAVLVEVAASRVDADAIAEAWLARAGSGPVDPEPGFRALVRAVAPRAAVRVVDWHVGA